MNSDSSTLTQQLQEATEGLLFQSEADYPLEPFLIEGSAKLDPQAPELREKLGGDFSHAKRLTPRRFFAPATKEEDWHNAEESRTVKRFQALVKLLEGSLKDLTVLKAGDVNARVLIVGRTPSGDLAGVRTQVVET